MSLVPILDEKDGVIAVHYRASDGRTAAVADFWVKPLMDGLGMSRSDAVEWQKQFAGLLVASYARHFTAPAHKPSDTSGQITGDKDCASAVGGPHQS